jgi:C4-dicarboxylate transporter, DctM subunit
MDGLTLSLVCLGAVLALIALRVPIGVSLAVVSFCGFWWLRSFNVALGQLREIPYYFAANWDLSAIPMFLLMGSIVYVSGIATALFRAARLWLSALPGGLAVGTNFAGAGLASISGSTLGVTYALGRIGVPEMLRAGYEIARWIKETSDAALLVEDRALYVALPVLLVMSLWYASARADDLLVPTTGGEHRASECTSEYPCVQPMMLAVDTLLPLVDFGQDGKWMPARSRGW